MAENKGLDGFFIETIYSLKKKSVYASFLRETPIFVVLIFLKERKSKSCMGHLLLIKEHSVYLFIMCICFRGNQICCYLIYGLRTKMKSNIQKLTSWNSMWSEFLNHYNLDLFSRFLVYEHSVGPDHNVDIIEIGLC